MRRFISVLLCVVLFAGSCPTTVFSIDLDFGSNDISFEEFSAQAIDLMQTDNVEAFSDDSVEEDEETTDTNRLIVKSDEAEIDTLGAVGYVKGYNDLHILQYASDEECDEALAFYEAQGYVDYVQEEFDGESGTWVPTGETDQKTFEYSVGATAEEKQEIQRPQTILGILFGLFEMLFSLLGIGA